MIRVCSVEDCERPAVGRGWCGMHYQRWYSTGSTDLTPPRPRCSVEDCRKPERVNGLCGRHFDRWKVTGSTDLSPDRQVNPLVCVCPAPDADPRRDFGMCQLCKRKPLALMAPRKAA